MDPFTVAKGKLLGREAYGAFGLGRKWAKLRVVEREMNANPSLYATRLAKRRARPFDLSSLDESSAGLGVRACRRLALRDIDRIRQEASDTRERYEALTSEGSGLERVACRLGMTSRPISAAKPLLKAAANLYYAGTVK